jgi:excisionase family DNA binding protein
VRKDAKRKEPKMHPEIEFLKLPEVAEMLNMKVPGVRRFIKIGTLEAKKVGRNWVVHRNAVRDLLPPDPHAKVSKTDERSTHGEG